MRKLTTILIAAIALSGCFELSYGPTRPHYSTPAPVQVHYNVDLCWDEPYVGSPHWCEWHGDGTACCAWHIGGGTYEEWCQWGDQCWDYNGSF
tara:strand:+ start:635 stop:913 length:279 start_codon:yes stop_codon:yes gene_type:complete